MAYDEVIHRFNDTTKTELLVPIAQALVSKGIRLGELNRNEEAIAAYDEVICRFSDTKVLGLQIVLANALLVKGFKLGELTRNEEAISIYDELIMRFGETKISVLRECVANAFINKGILLYRQNRRAEAKICFAKLIEIYGKDEELTIHLNNVTALVGLNRLKEAEELLDIFLQKNKLYEPYKDGFLSDLELLASAPNPPEGIRDFTDKAHRLFE